MGAENCIQGVRGVTAIILTDDRFEPNNKKVLYNMDPNANKK